jgi:hypothetical protein
MPRNAFTCRRVYRDELGAVRLCGGPMTFCRSGGMWTCTWCGRVQPGVHPADRRSGDGGREQDEEPPAGVEPATSRLQGGRSAS